MARKSTRRQKQAAATRQEIVQAARKLFGERGYTATSMADIAAEAETSVQTIYDSVGSKGAGVRAIVDLLDVEMGIPAILDEMRATRDPRHLIALDVRLQRQFQERCGDVLRALLSGAANEPDVAAAVNEGWSRHYGGARWIVEQLDAWGVLRAELSIDRAAASLAVISWLSCERYVERCGWTYDQFEAWLTEDLCRLLLRDPE
ncbi:MAG: helix-turn-helix domain-containing protein [Thermomicrobiales bacterium]